MSADRAQSLSKHFCLGDLLVDDSFPELAQALDPDPTLIAHLGRLARVLDCIYDNFEGGWTVQSGYRDAALNDACREKGLPASVDSLHLLGCAADLAPIESQDLEQVFDWISAQAHAGLELQEAVYYPKKGFIHVAVPHPDFQRPRRFIMRM